MDLDSRVRAIDVSHLRLDDGRDFIEAFRRKIEFRQMVCGEDNHPNSYALAYFPDRDMTFALCPDCKKVYERKMTDEERQFYNELVKGLKQEVEVSA